MTYHSPPVVLTFSASDPTGGAGLQADLLTLSSMGCHAVTVVTAITVQDTVGVADYWPLEARQIVRQARCVMDDIPVMAFKIGMVGSAGAAAAIAEVVADYPQIPLVFDPVLASGRGDALSNVETMDAMLALLIPRTTILTPNSLELRRLSARMSAEAGKVPEDALPEGLSAVSVETMSDTNACAMTLLEQGCDYVLLTGTHDSTVQVINTLYGSRADGSKGALRRDEWVRLAGSWHGSGCTLASAVTAMLAHQVPVDEAVFAAQEFVYESLRAGYRLGRGQFIPDRLFWARQVGLVA